MRPVVAIDFDGTLVDSMPALRTLAVEVVTSYRDDRIPPVPQIVKDYDLTAGETFRSQLEIILPVTRGFTPADRDKVAGVYEERKREVTMSAKPFEDVAQALHHLDDVQLWVVTSTVSDLVVQCLHWYDLWHYFTGCLGPEMGRKASKLKTVQAEWFVGDTDRDARHAEVARCAFLGVCRDRNLLSVDNTASTDLRQIAWTIQ